MEDLAEKNVDLADRDILDVCLGLEHVADIVELLNEQDIEEQARVLIHLPDERAIEVLDQPGLDDPAALIEALPTDRALKLLAGMSSDRVADVFRYMNDPPRSDLLQRLDPETRTSLDKVLSYPVDSAGSLMTTEFVSVPSSWTVEQTLDHIRRVERTRETIYSVYVLDPKTRQLLKAVALRRLITADPKASVLTAARFDKPITVSPTADREEVAKLISKYDLLAVPVVDESWHVIGIVTVDDIIDAIVAEGTEDAQKFGGMEALDEPYNTIGFWAMIKKRAGWLCILFLSEMLTASAMQHFSDELDKAAVLTLFIPLVMSSGGNSGSQATSLLIRAIALGEVKLRDWWRVALRELPTGVCLGAILGVLGVLRITVWQTAGFFDYGVHWGLVAFTIAMALTAIVTFGSLAGSMLPFALKKCGLDPASASAPFVATLVDVTGLVIYFSVALLILKGTLL
ncbi:magnesium transporter MgtE [Labrys miyagiensis]|uniref:Magnesium transporter MgtE n=1 Tax=Labrys miyagiensis TaxID=346912 RepID=A0ABQ6CU07_9HYPH|nr:magnesium transporter [Labrys miyagiensis]GLS21726.1 magnesium transporter MgtE [Labrys miyagiensis]